MVEGLTRYQITPPSDAIVVPDRQSMNDLVKLNPETILHAENGGYYLKNMDEEVVAIAGDDLCTEFDAVFASIDADVVGDGSRSGDEGSGSLGGANVTKRNEDLALPELCAKFLQPPPLLPLCHLSELLVLPYMLLKQPESLCLECSVI